MPHNQNTTHNIKAINHDLAILKAHFPQCFDKEGNFLLEKFQHNLSQKEINFSTESYGLDWLGKSYARLLASDAATTLLKADETHNAQAQNLASENVLIKDGVFKIADFGFSKKLNNKRMKNQTVVGTPLYMSV